MNSIVEETIENIKSNSLNQEMSDSDFRNFVINSIATMEQKLAYIDGEEEEEEEEDEEDEEIKRLTKKFNQKQIPSRLLSEVVGEEPRSRTEHVKAIWDYIKYKGLQDKKNRRMLNADDKLRPIFKKEQISMFDLAKILNEHLTPVE